jgi:hypothetical protein
MPRVLVTVVTVLRAIALFRHQIKAMVKRPFAAVRSRQMCVSLESLCQPLGKDVIELHAEAAHERDRWRGRRGVLLERLLQVDEVKVPAAPL